MAPIICHKLLASVVPLYLQAPQMLPAAAGVMLALLLAVIWLYPAQLRFVSWPWRGLLPVLRTVALAALAASILKPVAVRLASSKDWGALLVLVDSSQSMSVIDTTRSESQLVALADALGQLRPGARSGEVEALTADLEALHALQDQVKAAQDDVEYALISGRDVEGRRARLKRVAADYAASARSLATRAGNVGDDPDLRDRLSELAQIPDPDAADAWQRAVRARTLAASAAAARHQAAADKRLYDSDPQVHAACDAVAKLSRWSLAVEMLQRPGAGLLGKLAGKMPVEVAALGAKPTAALRVASLQGGQPALGLPQVASAYESDLTGGVAAASAASIAAGRPVRAVLLISDGRQVGGDARAVSGLTAPGVPVFSVGVAPPSPPRDVAFAHVSLPGSAFIGDAVVVRAELRHEGIESGTIDLHMKIGDLPEQVRAVELHGSQPAFVEFPPVELHPQQAGVQPVSLWFAHVPGEVTDLNNHVQRYLKVMPERMRVALWSASPTWDFQYLRNLLSHRSEMLLSEAMLATQSAHLSMTPQQILQQDLIVLCDVPVGSLDALQWDAVSRLVSERGGSVILVAGDAHLPSEYGSLIATSTLLPFGPQIKPQFHVWYGDQPEFRIVPGPEYAALDVLNLGAGADGAPRRWEELPPMYRFLQLPDARSGKLKPGAQVLLLEADSRAPILIERQVGAGRSFFLGVNETWRWRFDVGGRDQDRFWRQLIHYAAQEPYFATSGALSLDMDKAACRPDEPVRIRARLLDPQTAHKFGGACDVRILREGKSISTARLQATGVPGAGQYQGEIALPAGNYQVELSADKAHVRVPLRVEATDEAEMTNLAGDEGLLRQVAELSGGEYVPIDQAQRLPQRVMAIDDRRARLSDLRLWDGPYLFFLVLGCLAGEWAVRKRVGLA